MNLLTLFFAAAIVPLSLPCNDSGDGCMVYSQTMIHTTAGDLRRISWGANASDLEKGVEYNIDVLPFPPKDGGLPVMSLSDIPDSETAIDWRPIRAGLYYLRINACYVNGVEPFTGCSEWNESYAPLEGAQYPKGFIIFVKLAPASGGGVN